ncbi:MAG: hypothetical protein IPP60_08715 [Sphingobacteriales bacterium]|nr:hypothetical protein [Sphingobacteriales bacterium]
MEKHVLSKSTYMLGCQCTKRLYLHKFKSDLRNPADENQQAIFDAGTRVGEIARQLFPMGTDASPVDKFNYQESVLKTQELIANGIKVIYEACFQFDGVLCAIDILVKKKGKWYAYEVKGSTEVKNYHIEDAALQYFVITNSGLKLEDISIVYLNNKYVRQGDLDIQQLFSTESVLNRITIKQEAVVKKIKELKKIITEKKEPVIKVGLHCSDPFDCDFSNHCWKDIPTENSVMLLYKKDKIYFLEKEIYSFEEIPEDYKLDKRSSKKIDKLKDTEITINKEQIGNFLSKIAAPF